ncbi:MAG: acetyl-CoA decarbonylase/synthase complex subunit gamma [Peptococcaceae bacterium]|nr:acetyl-CoA decarbonylase/synthase complex subunit gamma [Peptococcaceae bacterium]
MGLTGLAIYKMLPKTNCKECGQATCLAFAMQLAAGKTSLDKCPYVSDEACEALGAASKPPIALITVGTGERAVEIGNETVLFRHDKRFVHPTAIAVTVSDTIGADELRDRIKRINNLFFDRVGQVYGVDLVAVRNDSGDPVQFAKTVSITQKETPLPLVLLSENTAAQEQALAVCGHNQPLIYAANADNYEAFTKLAIQHQAPLVVKGDGLDELAQVVGKVLCLGHGQIVLDSGAREVLKVLVDQTQIRRQALKRHTKSFGFPTICFAGAHGTPGTALDAAVYIAKYAAVLVLESTDPAEVLPLVTWRLNVYTDPQKPIAIEPKVYAVGNAGRNAPVILTTNFSLTYFCVLGDVEGARVPSYILPVDTDGTSVLTAWAAGKLAPEKIAAFIKECGIEDKVDHRRLIIPGGLAILRDKLQELSGWQVLVGPHESAGLPSFLRDQWT